MKRTQYLLLALVILSLLLGGCAKKDVPSAQEQYSQAVQLLDEGKTDDALRIFDGLGGHQESAKYAMYARSVQLAEKGMYSEAIASLQTLNGFKDASLLAVYYAGLQAEAELRYEDARDIYMPIAAYRDTLEHMAAIPDLILARDCEDILARMALTEQWEWRDISIDFLNTFRSDLYGLLSQTYSDSTDRLFEQVYDAAQASLNKNTSPDIAAAYTVFSVLEDNGYEKAAGKCDECSQAMYALAMNAYARKDYDKAAELFTYVSFYSDSEERAEQCRADKLYDAGCFADALCIYDVLPEAYHTHAADYAAMYEQALALYNDAAWNEAIDQFSALGAYGDCPALLKAAYYGKGIQLLDEKLADDARDAFVHAGDYTGAQAQIDKIDLFRQAEEQMKVGASLETAQVFADMGDYLYAPENLNACFAALHLSALDMLDDGKTAQAYELLQKIVTNPESAAVLKDIENQYAAAQTELANGNFQNAAELFAALNDYADSAEMIRECHYRQAQQLLTDGDLPAAVAVLSGIPGYQDAEALCNSALLTLGQQALDTEAYQEAAEHFAAYHGTLPDEQKAAIYSKAQSCFEAGLYAETMTFCDLLGDYSLSRLKTLSAQYVAAEQLLKEGKYTEAIEAFRALGRVGNASERILECRYLMAVDHMNQGDYTAAFQLFQNLKDYKDSAEQYKKCVYAHAEQLLGTGFYATAYSFFSRLGDYQDAVEKARLSSYQAAIQAMEQGNYTTARSCFERHMDYQDSTLKHTECAYLQGQYYFEAGYYGTAKDWFRKAADMGYTDSARMAAECSYMQGYDWIVKGEITLALNNLEEAAGASLTQALLYDIAVECLHIQDYVPAIRALYAAGDYAPALELLEETAQRLKADGKDALAFAACTALRDHQDVTDFQNGLVVTMAERKQLSEQLGASPLHAKIYSNMQSNQVISASPSTFFAIKPDGTVMAAGRNAEGQCNVSSWTDIIGIAAVSDCTFGLKADNTLVTTTESMGRYNENNVRSWSDIVKVAASSNFTVGLKADGTVIAVGSGNSNQCDVTEWSDIIDIAVGRQHTVGLKADGTVVAVGSRSYGQCNTESWTDIIAIAAGSGHTVGLKADGTVVTVGSNVNNQCNTEKWTGIIAVSCGDYHTVGLKEDGTVVATGNNLTGQCDVEDWTDIVAIVAAGNYTVGLKDDGTFVATGANGYGQCDLDDWNLYD